MKVVKIASGFFNLRFMYSKFAKFNEILTKSFPYYFSVNYELLNFVKLNFTILKNSHIYYVKNSNTRARW